MAREDYSPEAYERRLAYTRAYHHARRDDPEFKAGRRAYKRNYRQTDAYGRALARQRAYYHEHKNDPGFREKKKVYAKAYRAGHKREIHHYQMERWYGLAGDQYDALLASQDGVCGLCGKAPNGRALCVDHNHESGKVRGLLCQQCNQLLYAIERADGWRERAEEWLRRA